MKKLISLMMAVAAVMVLAGSADAHSGAFNFDCSPCGCGGGCGWDVAVAYDYDDVYVYRNNSATVTTTIGSQAVSGVNEVINKGHYTDIYLTTKNSYAYTDALTEVNKNSSKVNTKDVVLAGNVGSGKGVDIAVAYSEDKVKIWTKNWAKVTHKATSLAMSGDNYIYNEGNGCGYCAPGYRDEDCCCKEDFCEPTCCDKKCPVKIDVDTGKSTAVTDSSVLVNTNTEKIDTKDLVVAGNLGSGSGVDVAVAVEKDYTTVIANNSATVKATVSSAGVSGQNTIKNYGNYALIDLDTGDATAKVDSTVVVNSNYTTVGCHGVCK